MHPVSLFMLALISPILLAVTTLLPPYACILLATYVIYDKGQNIHPLADKLYDVFYIIDTYVQLFTHWSRHMGDADILDYTLPLVGIPLIGLMVAYWLSRMLSIKLRDIFQSGLH